MNEMYTAVAHGAVLCRRVESRAASPVVAREHCGGSSTRHAAAPGALDGGGATMCCPYGVTWCRHDCTVTNSGDDAAYRGA